MSVSALTKKRLIKDITDLYHSPLEEQGIYYIHDESNMLRGYAMIKGPTDTPYEHGFYTFRFEFPTDYPHSPPTVIFTTGDGHMRFNPNLYVNGKVCLSILNTWEGERWTSCQSIRTILLTLVTVLNENPLSNEPAYNHHKSTMTECQNYIALVKYKNIQVALLSPFEKGLATEYLHFMPHIVKYLRENGEKILKMVEMWKKEGIKLNSFTYREGMTVSIPYNYDCVLKFTNLFNRLQLVLENIK
jgi:ubiquitin-protein ligase